MKRVYKALAIVLAVVMLMSCCAFAIDDEKKPLTRDSYGCSCGHYSCYAYTTASDAIGSIYVHYSGSVFISSLGKSVSVSGSETRYNYDSVSCGESYSYASSGHIDADHLFENVYFDSHASFY